MICGRTYLILSGAQFWITHNSCCMVPSHFFCSSMALSLVIYVHIYLFIQYAFIANILLVIIAYAPPPSSLALLVFFYSQEPQVQRLIHQSPLPHSLIHTAIPLFILSFWWTSAFTSFYIKWIMFLKHLSRKCLFLFHPSISISSPIPFFLPVSPSIFQTHSTPSRGTRVFIPAGFYLCYCSFYCLSTLGQEIWMNVDNLC